MEILLFLKWEIPNSPEKFNKNTQVKEQSQNNFYQLKGKSNPPRLLMTIHFLIRYVHFHIWQISIIFVSS